MSRNVVVTTESNLLPRGASGSARCYIVGLTVLCMAHFFMSGDALAGDAKAGRAKATQCQACHGLDGLSKLPDAPHIAGQPEPYVIKALRDYKQGVRKNELMSVVVQQLSLQDIDDLAAYYSAIEVSVKVPQ